MKLSVIIPNYNRASTVTETIENMLRQSRPPDEVIVVDDGSTDNSREVIREFGQKVCLVEQSNQGPGAARNAGLEVASGEFVQFMDSDDVASLNKLELQLDALTQTGADLAYCPWVRSEICGGALRFCGPILQSSALPAHKHMLEWALGEWCLVFQNCLFRRRILDQAGRFRTDMMVAEDTEYLIRVLLAGAHCVFTPECLVFYRVNGDNQLLKGGATSRRRAEDVSRFFEVAGQAVEPCLSRLHESTRRETALRIFRHVRHCRRHKWREPDPESTLCRVTRSFPQWQLAITDLWQRARRKFSTLTPETPMQPALAPTIPDAGHRILAEGAGYLVTE
jgi:glycosyltransferase involved in cell wall biosynthesis